jgi:GNAT superfamily N-acetyltransferase
MVRREGAAEGRCTYRAPVLGRLHLGVAAVMSTPSVDIIRWGRERARTWPWQGDSTVAFLAPVPEAPILSAAFLGRCLTILGERGFARVVTSALSPMEQTGFLAAGFEVAEELHLLSLELGGLPPRPAIAVTRVTNGSRPQVLAIDAEAFSPFWQLDEHGLEEALGATPRTRFRGVLGEDLVFHPGLSPHPSRHPSPSPDERGTGERGTGERGTGERGTGERGTGERGTGERGTGDRLVVSRPGLIGYAIHGRSGTRGFVQRLAVAPEARRLGVGRGLLLDGLYWMRRRGVRRAVVNTQVGNDAALTLYYDVGFRREPSGLSVMEAGLR